MNIESLWFDLGQTMRRVRDTERLSLAAVAAASGWSKATLSQVELGKARPSRELVDWYDGFFGCQGMLLAIYAEARAAGSAVTTRASSAAMPPSYPLPGDDILLLAETGLAHGQLVSMSQQLEIVWTVRNCGTVPWRGRRMMRVGPYAGGRVISSVRNAAVPDLDPGETGEVRCELRAPYTGGTFIAYWKLADAQELFCFPHYSPVSVLIVVDQPLFDQRDGTAIEVGRGRTLAGRRRPALDPPPGGTAPEGTSALG